MAIQLPSASNTAGTLLGTLAGALVASAAPSLPFVVSAAAALGMTPVGLAGVAAIGITALVNYGVTHLAEVKNLNDLVSAYWPEIEKTYPAGKNGVESSGQVSRGQPNANFNKE